jgi:hypothetical protein
MPIPLPPARAERLFIDLDAQQQALLAEISAVGPNPRMKSSVPLPACPACDTRSHQVVVAVDTGSVRFVGCRHVFDLSPQALVAGLRAMRTV